MILKKSKWLQYDADLTEFVRSCFSDNKITHFSKEISTQLQSNAANSAKVATECKLFKISGSVKAQLDKKIEYYETKTKKYLVEF